MVYGSNYANCFLIRKVVREKLKNDIGNRF